MKTARRRTLAVAMLAVLAAAACSRDPAAPDAGSVVAEPPAAAAAAPDWVGTLDAEVVRLDEAMPGDLGVYVRRFGERAGELDRGAGRDWYLSSTIKVPVAIAVLEQVDAGGLSLGTGVELLETDLVDGAGDMLQQAPGTRFDVATLLRKSLRDSDSTATDMLIRLVGAGTLNRRIEAWTGGGFAEITPILQVRYDAYGALHPGVRKLSNRELLAVRAAGSGEARLLELARVLGVPREQLGAKDLEAVFEDYYDRGLNAARLDAFGDLLARVAAGELLSDGSRGLLLDHMRAISTGDRRIAAGLPAGADFAQKTGTQIGRACNVGILQPDRGETGSTVVVACAEGYERLEQAEAAFQGLGRALAAAGLAE